MTILKLVSEVVTLQFDFLTSLRFGETITGTSFAISLESGLDLDPSAIVSGSATVNGPIVSQKIQAGNPGVTYIVTCSAVGSLGTTYVLSEYVSILSDPGGYAVGSFPSLTGILPDGNAGIAYSHNLDISGGYLPYSPVGLIAGAPPWMGFSVTGDQLICAGTPTEGPITYNFSPTILDSALNPATAPQSIDIGPPLPPPGLPNVLFDVVTWTGDGTGSRIIPTVVNASGGGVLFIKLQNGIPTVNNALCRMVWSTDGTAVYNWWLDDPFDNNLPILSPIELHDGYIVVQDNLVGGLYCAWIFRKYPGFLDVIHYTGNGGVQNILHNNNQIPGMLVVRSFADTGTTQGALYHGSVPTAASRYMKWIGGAIQISSSTIWNATAPNNARFTVGNDVLSNALGTQYAAWVWGATGALGNLLSFGTVFDGSGLVTLNAGFSPYAFLLKSFTVTGAPVNIYDQKRNPGFGVNSYALYIDPIQNPSTYPINLTPTGVTWQGSNGGSSCWLAVRTPVSP